MQPKVFPAFMQAKRRISRTAYTLFGVGAAMLAIGGVTMAISFAVGEQPALPLLTAAIALACTGVLGLIAGIATLTRLRQPIQVEITPHRLIWREGSKSATLEFEEVVRVELMRAEEEVSEDFTLGYPVVRFIEDDGEMMEFDATFTDRGFTHRARFDTRGITQEVLQHVGQRTVISPAVQEYVRSGEVDIDSLPER